MVQEKRREKRKKKKKEGRRHSLAYFSLSLSCFFFFLLFGVFRFGVCMIEAISCTQTEFCWLDSKSIKEGGLQGFESNKTGVWTLGCNRFK